MLKVIDDEKLTRKYAGLFTRKFKPFAGEPVKVKLGHQGASFAARVRWSEKLGIWVFSKNVKGVRYWNVFGTGRPEKDSQLTITAEINFPGRASTAEQEPLSRWTLQGVPMRFIAALSAVGKRASVNHCFGIITAGCGQRWKTDAPGQELL